MDNDRSGLCFTTRQEMKTHGNMPKLRLLLCTVKSSSKTSCGFPKRHLMPCTPLSICNTGAKPFVQSEKNDPASVMSLVAA